MTTETLATILGVGSGVSIGWVLKAWWDKLSPTGIAKVAESLSATALLARDDAQEEVKRAQAAANDAVSRYAMSASEWRAHAERLTGLLTHLGARALPQPPPSRTLTPEQAANRAVGTPDPLAEARDKLLAAEFTADEADAILRGDTDNLPPGGLADRFAIGMMRNENGTT
jgi:hypothetical protein